MVGKQINHEGIAVRQNKPEVLELLRAQRCSYGRAKTIQSCFLILSLLLPCVSLFLGDLHPLVRPMVALISVVTLLIDVAFFSKWQKQLTKRGAKIQEEIDTKVFALPWNRLVVGREVDPEEIRPLIRKPMTEQERESLVNWYAPCVDELPLHVGRLVCQRTNVTYDKGVRVRYANALIATVVLLGSGLSVVGLVQSLPLDQVVLVLMVPAMPVTTWLLREYRKQADALDTLANIKSEIEKVWDKALAGAGEETLTQDARGLQDAIYRHRTSNPLIFDWLYSLLRNDNEDVANHTAQALVEAAKKRVPPQS
jgi:hypothetical protein